jgi:hypothetical protein
LVPSSDYPGRYLRYRMLKTIQASRLRFPPLLSFNHQGLEILSKTVVYNGLHDHAVPAQRRGRTISVLLAEPKRILQDERVHVPGNFGRSEKGRSKQARCLHCYRDEGVLRWTSFYCVQCGIPLCMPGSRHIRDCFEHHMRQDPVALGNMKRVGTG